MCPSTCQINNGASFVNVDRIYNKRDNSPALLFQGVVSSTVFSCTILLLLFVVLALAFTYMHPWFPYLFSFIDDGGGMSPDSLRKCMSLGYSMKKANTTIGQCEYCVFPSLSHNSHLACC